MKNNFRPRHARGFSLLEVLVAIVILSIGLLALAILQLNLIRSSTDAKAQSVALALAKEQIESLRAFPDWPSYIALTDSTSTNADFGTEYTITTTIDRFALVDDDPDFFQKEDNDTASDADMTAGGYIVGRDFKRASVEVTWTDAAGADNAVVLDDIIDGLIPADSARVAKNTAGSKPRNIQILINDPGSEAGVIPIAVNTNDPDAEVSTAATNPKPEIGGNNNDRRVYETRFDVLTYAGLSSGDFLAQARVETTVIKCTCDEDLADEDVKGYRPTYWNGTRYVAPALATYTQPAGWAQEGDNNATESEKCTECCRDHHDPDGVTGAKFDPRRVEATQGDDEHEHFLVLDDGTLGDPATNEGLYTEACRLIRVDGIFRVAADMYNDHFNLLETKNDDTDTEFAPSDTAKTNYQNFALAYLDSRVTLNTFSSTFNDLLDDTDVDALESTHNINEPASMTMPSDTTEEEGFWLHARGLYIDYFEPVTVELIDDAQDDCKGTDGNAPDTTAEKEACVLPLVPFTSINLTELSEWSPLTHDDVQVTNRDFLCSELLGDCDGIDPDAPTRGDAYAGDAPTDGNTQDARAQILSSTAGVALQIFEIDDEPWNVDVNGDSQTFDTQPFVVSGGGGGDPSYFIATLDGYALGDANPNFTSTNDSDCAIDEQGNPDTITCELPSAGPETVFFKAWELNFGSEVAANSVTNPTATAMSNVSCKMTDGTFITKGTVPTNKFNVKKCRNFDITQASINNGTPFAVTPDLEGTTDGSLTETQAITLTLSADDQVEFTITESVGTLRYPTVCTCQNPSCSNYNMSTFAACP
jgi:type IV pilus modification protein PilV